MFAEKPKSPIGEFLVKFANFRKDLNEARRQNLVAKAKKEKLEKKKREEEAKKAKAAAKSGNAPTAGDSKASAKAKSAKASPAKAASAATSANSKRTAADAAPMNPLIPLKKKYQLVIPEHHKDLFSGAGARAPLSSRGGKRTSETSGGDHLLNMGSSVDSRLSIGPAAKLLDSGPVGAGKKPLINLDEAPVRMSIGVAQRSTQKSPTLATKQPQRSAEV